MLFQSQIKALLKTLLLSLLLVSGLSVASSTDADIYPFEDPLKRERFMQLTKQLRCLVCQNQNIAESNAGLAKDIRDVLYRQLLAGATDQQVIEFMVARYGDFILFRPPLRASTWLLWLGPLLLMVVGFIVLWRLIAGVDRRPDALALSREERDRLRRLKYVGRREASE